MGNVHIAICIHGPKGDEEFKLIDVPDIRQHDHYSCGACAAMCVGQFYGVGPKKLEQWKKDLGTTLEQSTRPDAIAEYLKGLGLQVETKQGMDVGDLQEYTAQGWPVITPVQDWGNRRQKGADFAYGHYLTVIGTGGKMVFCQDSSEDNVAGDEGSIGAPGRVMIEERKFDKEWHDKDIKGKKYDHFGIAVGPKQ